jgi:hypothetical protein
MDIQKFLQGSVLGTLILFSAITFAILFLHVAYGSGGKEFSPHTTALTISAVWTAEVLLLMPLGSLPDGKAARFIFIVAPVIIGFLLFSFIKLAFIFGVTVASVNVGYNIAVTIGRSR